MKTTICAAIALTAGVVVASAGAVHAESDDIEFTRKVCLSLAVSTNVKPENAGVSRVNMIPEMQVKWMMQGLANGGSMGTPIPMIAGFPDANTSKYCFVVQIQVRPRIEIVEEVVD